MRRKALAYFITYAGLTMARQASGELASQFLTILAGKRLSWLTQKRAACGLAWVSEHRITISSPVLFLSMTASVLADETYNQQRVAHK